MKEMGKCEGVLWFEYCVRYMDTCVKNIVDVIVPWDYFLWGKYATYVPYIWFFWWLWKNEDLLCLLEILYVAVGTGKNFGMYDVNCSFLNRLVNIEVELIVDATNYIKSQQEWPPSTPQRYKTALFQGRWSLGRFTLKIGKKSRWAFLFQPVRGCEVSGAGWVILLGQTCDFNQQPNVLRRTLVQKLTLDQER